MALHRFEQLDPQHEGPLSAADIDVHLRRMLCDKVGGISRAVLAATQAVGQNGPVRRWQVLHAAKCQQTSMGRSPGLRSAPSQARRCTVMRFASSVLHAVLQDPSVMAASLCALGELVARDARPYRNLIPSFVSILKQITDGKLPKAFDYHKVPAPFIQVPAASPVLQSRDLRTATCMAHAPAAPQPPCKLLHLTFH